MKVPKKPTLESFKYHPDTSPPSTINLLEECPNNEEEKVGKQ
jgi:hypothetical protein